MPTSLKQKDVMMMVGGAVLLVVIAVAVFVFTMKKKAKVAPEVQKSPELVPAGQLPETGRKFIVASASTGKYLADNGVMTSDINQAKVLTYGDNGQTNETVYAPSTLVLSTSPLPLIINFDKPNALIGSTYYSNSNGIVMFAAILNGDDTWTFGSVVHNIPAALNETYYPYYGALFYYV